ncbi:MAG: DUF1800 domain-containing protein [Chloroflexota bacterium]
MQVTRRDFFQRLLNQPSNNLQNGDEISHLLNRITWGPLPAEMARAREIGYEGFVDEQLAYESLENGRLDREMRFFSHWRMSRRELYSIEDSNYRAYLAIQKGVLTQAVFSHRQLFERMVDFWRDHFNIPADIDYGPDVILFEKNVLQKHALGKFRNILIASAKHPAMLAYLDNYVSTKAYPNENYARELMELHSLGVDGGYTETDVKETARAFTGWTIHEKTKDGFYFNPNNHDEGPKTVLGRKLGAGRGIEDGLQVLSILAIHPSTATFLSRKLCVRFVSDNPPESIVVSAAKVWVESDGDIRTVLRHILLSEEFRQSQGQKFRRPYEFFVGALRATGTRINAFWRTETFLRLLGQYPHGWHPPNGYPDVAAAWINAGGLLYRWNVSMALTHTAYSDHAENYGYVSRLRDQIGTPTTVGELVDQVATRVWGEAIGEPARSQFVEYAADGKGADTPLNAHLFSRKFASLFGLMLASPHYQWR